MDSKLIPLIEVPYFLDDTNSSLSLILITVFVIVCLLLIILSKRIMNSFRIYRIILDCKQRRITQREAAYRLTSTTRKLTSTGTTALYNKQETEIIRNLKYNKQQHDDLLPVLYKTIYSVLFGKY